MENKELLKDMFINITLGTLTLFTGILTLILTITISINEGISLIILVPIVLITMSIIFFIGYLNYYEKFMYILNGHSKED